MPLSRHAIDVGPCQNRDAWIPKNRGTTDETMVSLHFLYDPQFASTFRIARPMRTFGGNDCRFDIDRRGADGSSSPAVFRSLGPSDVQRRSPRTLRATAPNFTTETRESRESASATHEIDATLHERIASPGRCYNFSRDEPCLLLFFLCGRRQPEHGD